MAKPLNLIPRLRSIGIYTERGQRSLLRGMRYRLFRFPNETVAFVYSRKQMAQWVAHFFEGAPMPPDTFKELP